MSVFVIVDRNAIWQNDRDGGDRPTVVLHRDDTPPLACHEVLVYNVSGIVGTFRSQSRGRPVDPARPHVWFELADGATAAAVIVDE